MTKKDYELIAGVLKYQKPVGTNTELAERLHRYWVDTVMSFTSVLEVGNPRFDRNKFLQACGIDEPSEEELQYVRDNAAI